MCLFEEQGQNYVSGFTGLERDKGHFSPQGDQTVPQTVALPNFLEVPTSCQRQARDHTQLESLRNCTRTQWNEQQTFGEAGEAVKGNWAPNHRQQECKK